MSTIRVKKSTEKPESKEILADAVVKISAALNDLNASGINEDAIIILIQHKTRIPQKQIKEVFKAMRQLKAWYCN